MGWREDLQPATFRGVPFYTSQSGKTGGKRSQIHQFPGRDEPFVEELGLEAKRFTIAAYLLGDDVNAKRQALENALDEKGPGELVDHFRGQLDVRVLSYRARHSTAEGGFVEVEIEFVEAGVDAPDEGVDPRGRMEGVAGAAKQSLAGIFAKGFLVDGMPDFVAEAAEELLGEASTAFEDSARLVVGDFDERTALKSQITALTAASSTLIYDPATLVSETTKILEAMAGLTEGRGADALRQLMTFGADLVPVTGTTPSRLQQAANQYHYAALIRRMALIESARSAILADYDSYDAAAAERDFLTGILEEEMLEAGDVRDDEGFEALRKLYAEVSNGIRARGATLARIVEYSPPETLPALVLAYRIYGDATRDEDLIRRNRVRHPGFVPGGAALELLSA